MTEYWTKRKNPTWVGYSATDTILFHEMYKYNPAGLMLGKKLWAAVGPAWDQVEAYYTYDNEGRMVTQQYPDALAVGAPFGNADTTGETFAYTFDGMGRPNAMTSNAGATSWISGVTYNHLGLPTAVTAGNASVAGETRQYNVLGQLTQIVSGAYRFDYNFHPTANDGRIISQSSYQSGTLQETVSYTTR